MAFVDVTVGPRELVLFQMALSTAGVTASVTITDLVTDELIGCAVQELSPFDALDEVWQDLYSRCPRQLPLV